jgi:hypothetical protein
VNEDEEVVVDIVDVVVVGVICGRKDFQLVAGVVLFSCCCWSLERRGKNVTTDISGGHLPL